MLGSGLLHQKFNYNNSKIFQNNIKLLKMTIKDKIQVFFILKKKKKIEYYWMIFVSFVLSILGFQRGQIKVLSCKIKMLKESLWTIVLIMIYLKFLLCRSGWIVFYTSNNLLLSLFRAVCVWWGLSDEVEPVF